MIGGDLWNHSIKKSDFAQKTTITNNKQNYSLHSDKQTAVQPEQ
jgi:hypothetical protein